MESAAAASSGAIAAITRSRCVDNDLHRITNVVEIETLRRLCIGKIVARRIGVLDPDQSPVADHQIGVVIEAQERGDCAHPFLDVAADEETGIYAGGVLRREEHGAQS